MHWPFSELHDLFELKFPYYPDPPPDRVVPATGVRLLSRKNVLLSSLSLVAGAVLGSCSPSSTRNRVVRMGYQLTGDLIRERGVLDRRLKDLGVGITWSKFINGPPLLEALNGGSIDIGPTGETPPIFAQIAGADLIYAANVPASSNSTYVVITPTGSGVRTVKDLKGKKVAYPQGTAATYYLGLVLKEVGLDFSDVEQVSLQIGDYVGAMQNNKVAAFVTAELFLQRDNLESQVRVIRDSRGISTPGLFILASRRFATQNPDLLKIVLEEYHASGLWRNTHLSEASEILSKQLNVPADRLERLYRKNQYVMKPIDEQVLDEQQKVADFLYDVKVIPKKVNIREATLTPEQYAAIVPEAIRATG